MTNILHTSSQAFDTEFDPLFLSYSDFVMITTRLFGRIDIEMLSARPHFSNTQIP